MYIHSLAESTPAFVGQGDPRHGLTASRLTATGPRCYKHKRTMSPKTQRKIKGILIRVTETQKQLLAKTAKSEGLGLSSWMLNLALRAAQRPKGA